MAQKRKRAFDGLYAQLEETDGNVVLFSAKGEPSVIFEMTNPVQQLCTDAEQYLRFQDVLSGVVQTLGEGYALQKQDILCKQSYRHEVPENAEFLTKSYFRYFEGREFTEIRTFLIITQEARRGQFVQYDPKRWLDFHSKVAKVDDILKEKGIKHRKLNKAEVNEYCHRFMAFRFRHGPFSMTNFKASDEYLKTGGRVIRSYPLVDIDEINLPSVIKPYTQMSVNGYGIATDLLSFLTQVPFSDCVVFNQVVQIPEQRKLLRKLQAKAKRHGSMPDPSNKIAKADIEEVLNRLAIDSTQLVYCNFNILVSCPADKVTPVTSYLETKLYECGIMPSRTAYNQLELFTDSFPGNAYAFNPDYDLFLTLSDAALCFFFKEHLKGSEETPLTTYYTDRQGLPVCIDITGKEGKVKMTDNANFFCIGPSGSGKSFHMNSVVRQLLEQKTDVVMVDTGDSYEGICGYYKGTYISYSKEKPISMNPFKVTKEEYDQNFGEKKNFLKSLIFLIYKGNEFPTKIEDMLVNQTIVEYYEAYFHPFTKFTEKEREGLRQKLLVASKMEEDYDKFSHSMEDIEAQIQDAETDRQSESKALMLPTEARRLKLLRQCRSLLALARDEAASKGEKERALLIIENYKKELYNNSILIKIDKQIDHIEEQKRRLKVTELSFNSYYEFALERIPQIVSQEKIQFNIRDFAAIQELMSRVSAGNKPFKGIEPTLTETENDMANENKTQGFEYGAIAASLGMKDGEVKDVMARISELAAMEPKYREIQKSLSDAQTVIAGKDASIRNLQTDLAAATARLSAYEQKEKNEQASRIETLVENAIAEGKIDREAKTQWVEMAGSNFELAESTLASIPAREKISKEIADDPANIQATAEATKTAEQLMAEKVAEVVGADFKFRKL